MQKFKDNTGREWAIELNGWAMKRIHERLGIACRNPQAVFESVDDLPLFCDILYVLCEAQAKERGVSDEDFGKSLGGDAIDEAVEAFISEAIPFFPKNAREPAKKLFATTQDYKTRAAKNVAEKMTGTALKKLVTTSLKQASKRVDAILAGKTSGG